MLDAESIAFLKIKEHFEAFVQAGTEGGARVTVEFPVERPA
ncbi:MAG: hypothetical protein QNK37_37115 [Acidobacteriota bacterium]|nr:hypothetical protein [Acidobacteriota bacterium]